MNFISVILTFALLPLLCSSANINVGIVNGTEVKPHSRPYMVSLQNKTGEHICGGFLVSERFVMTAAHCKLAQILTAVLGAHDLRSNDFVRIPVKTFIMHPGYESKPCLRNDIMLLELAETPIKNKNIACIQIPKDHPVKMSNCSTAGWGQISTNGFRSTRLMEAPISVQPSKICKDHWGRCYSNTGILCAGGARHGFCTGDSGGPLVCNGVAMGLASFYEKANCDKPKKPNIYTKISDYLHWIRNITDYCK